MENLLYNISQVLGLTIIHSLWQGLLIYFVLRMVLLFSGQLPASKKYTLSVLSLLAITGWFIYTVVNEIQIYNWLAVKPAGTASPLAILQLPAGVQQFNDKTIRYYYSIEEYLPYISMVYLLGLLFNLTRLVLARKKINNIRQTMSIDVMLQLQVNKFAGMLGINHKVQLGLSSLVDIPCMVGYFKPVILLPFTLSTYLGAEEIEAILLHELAHIKRNDYLVNLLQQVIGILLFFNPCAQLISKLINEERENSCDDLVVSTTSNPLTYAKALLKLEQTNEKNLQLAMSATGKKYYLLNRIERIMKTKKQNQSIRPALLALVILTMGIGSIALLNPEIAQGKISVKAPIHAIINNLLTDTTRKTKKTTTYKKAYKAKANVKYNNDHKFNYAYNNGDTWDFHDAELDRLSREVEKYGEAIGKYYESGDYKKQTEALEEKGREMEAFYNKPELKRLQEEMEKAGEEFQKNYGETSETKETSKKMEELGKKIETYYNSTEFKKINEALEKKYGIPHEHNYRDDKDENYRKYQAELKTQIPAEVTQYNVELKELGKKLRAHFNSAGYREHSERLRALGDSLRRAFRNPGMEQQKAEMQALSRKVRDYSHNPEIKKQQELLRQATAKMRAYMNTPDFKRRLEEYKKDRRAHGWDGDDNDHDSSDAVSDTTKNN